MKHIKIVIGANFGDEGKGTTTNYFAKKATNGIVVRYNGGAQAGHTVIDDKNNRIVFGHFGSGTTEGLPTYYTQDFIFNPMAFTKQRENLVELGYNPVAIAHPNCTVTTPIDMAINQAIERKRGSNRHGSCGYGIFETFKRSQEDKYKITLAELLFLVSEGREAIEAKLISLIENYYKERTKELGLEVDFMDYLSEFVDELDIASKYLNEHIIIGANYILKDYDWIIFEGAQGLLLDMDNKEYFPHLTPSKTGSHNVAKILPMFDDIERKIEVVYVTRPYITRHGAGRLDFEIAKPTPLIIDKTNMPNDFQGALRFGVLDLGDFHRRINEDYDNILKFGAIKSVALTCLDQVEKGISFRQELKLEKDEQAIEIKIRCYNKKQVAYLFRPKYWKENENTWREREDWEWKG